MVNTCYSLIPFPQPPRASIFGVFYKYNLIAFQGDAYTNSAKLTVTPTPDSECRIFMAYVPLDAPVEVEPQQLETFERTGFAVVEWGGAEIRQ